MTKIIMTNLPERAASGECICWGADPHPRFVDAPPRPVTADGHLQIEGLFPELGIRVTLLRLPDPDHRIQMSQDGAVVNQPPVVGITTPTTETDRDLGQTGFWNIAFRIVIQWVMIDAIVDVLIAICRSVFVDRRQLAVRQIGQVLLRVLVVVTVNGTLFG